MPHANINLFRDYKRLAKLFYEGTVFVAVDTETTGLSKNNNFLMEIGAVKFTVDGSLSLYDELIKPREPIPLPLVHLTGITPQMVENCPPEEKVLPSFLNYIGNAVLIAHNAPFDIGFLNATLERMSFSHLKNKVIDTLPLSRWAYPQFGQQKKEHPYSLQSLAQVLNIEVKAAHRAHDDARVCMELFKKIIEDTKSRQIDYSILKTGSLFDQELF